MSKSQSTASAASALRTLNHLLQTWRKDSLPELLPHLLPLVHASGPLIASQQAQASSKNATENSLLWNKYRTQLTALLQAKGNGGAEARWATVVLVKATIEVGEWEVLQNAGGWVRSLLGLLAVSISHSLVFKLEALAQAIGMPVDVAALSNLPLFR
jgi:pre-rRNA-processing protein RIX1